MMVVKFEFLRSVVILKGKHSVGEISAELRGSMVGEVAGFWILGEFLQQTSRNLQDEEGCFRSFLSAGRTCSSWVCTVKFWRGFLLWDYCTVYFYWICENKIIWCIWFCFHHKDEIWIKSWFFWCRVQFFLLVLVPWMVSQLFDLPDTPAQWWSPNNFSLKQVLHIWQKCNKSH